MSNPITTQIVKLRIKESLLGALAGTGTAADKFAAVEAARSSGAISEGEAEQFRGLVERLVRQ